MALATQARYQVGSTMVGQRWALIAWLGTTLGPSDGEGHCHSEGQR